ncbi:C-X-C motif chemokine 11 [Salmo trutta]|uniref:C-X-C motif chemokine 11 n=1 Tax=Salmo trutta TaxID=8032 RepID=UPI001130227B|nr:C-X-C motif chemokine 11-like [Salmo trutta]
MKGLILVVVLVTLMISTDAFLMHRRQRCLCLKTRDRVNSSNIVQSTVHQRSAMCDHVEIVVKLKIPSKHICLNPDSKMGRRIQTKWNLKN